MKICAYKKIQCRCAMLHSTVNEGWDYGTADTIPTFKSMPVSSGARGIAIMTATRNPRPNASGADADVMCMSCRSFEAYRDASLEELLMGCRFGGDVQAARDMDDDSALKLGDPGDRMTVLGVTCTARGWMLCHVWPVALPSSSSAASCKSCRTGFSFSAFSDGVSCRGGSGQYRR
ncbi:unnamed protein product [Mycena citricolor]|uniref:Uncharacterized protein n=1 Tax=Mycena citricolor TaxID=2018698 RepID=A0AAD2K7U0_9AGAR|nr:unnamed protein product [Mycena citricolor]